MVVCFVLTFFAHLLCAFFVFLVGFGLQSDHLVGNSCSFRLR